MKNRSVKSILFCSAVLPELELGASRVVVELAEAMREIGWRCDVVGPRDVSRGRTGGVRHQDAYAAALRVYLKAHAGEYDVVEYPHNRLPYRRTEFAPETLFVARSVLLRHHFSPYPFTLSWRRRIGMYLRGSTPSGEAEKGIALADATITGADLVNVSNFHDRTVLVGGGVPPGKIIVMPFGLDRDRREAFDLCRAGRDGTPIVVFIGRFDRRKGSGDLPLILEGIAGRVPGVRFRFLGTGLSRTAVLANFSAGLAARVKVVARYASGDLPGLLEGCSAGIFPSYLEGFPFAVLEMLAASIPVVAYDAPGAPMMLADKYLVPRGDVAGMTDKVTDLLASPAEMFEAVSEAAEVSRRFRWESIAAETAHIYSLKAAARREGQPAWK